MERNVRRLVCEQQGVLRLQACQEFQRGTLRLEACDDAELSIMNKKNWKKETSLSMSPG